MFTHRLAAVLGCLLLLSACGSQRFSTSASKIHWNVFDRYQTQHVVRRGETLYAIAFRYDLEYHRLAWNNRLRPPYTLRVGQVLFLRTTRPLPIRHVSSTRFQHRPVFHAQTRPFSRETSLSWLWPVKGRLMSSFSPEEGRKGIDIVGHRGQPIYASQAGVVAYAGAGLPGYGNLIILNHAHRYLTAYGYNATNLVKEGQAVRAGQIIGLVGLVDHRYWGLHFEIRHAGRPQNPLRYL